MNDNFIKAYEWFKANEGRRIEILTMSGSIDLTIRFSKYSVKLEYEDTITIEDENGCMYHVYDDDNLNFNTDKTEMENTGFDAELKNEYITTVALLI